MELEESDLQKINKDSRGYFIEIENESKNIAVNHFRNRIGTFYYEDYSYKFHTNKGLSPEQLRVVSSIAAYINLLSYKKP